MGKLTDKVAVITGAASGIGKALAIKFYNEKYKLILLDKDDTQLQAIKNQLDSDNNNILILT